MTKFLLLTEFYPPSHGGIQASLESLVRSLGDDVTVLAPHIPQSEERHINQSLFSGKRWPRWWWLVWWLQRAKRDGLQIVIFGHFSAAVIAAWLNSIRGGAQYVILIHGNDLLSENKRWYIRPFVGSMFRRASWIGVNSTFVHDIVHAYGVPKVDIMYTHPFVIADHIPKSVDHPPSHRLITVCRLVARKNVQAVIEAVKKLQPTFPDIHLDIVGDGPEKVELQNLIATYHIQSVVALHGQVSDEEKWSLLQRADIFVLVPQVLDHGTDVEGLGLVYLEAAATGLPIIASDTGGIRDAVINGKTGLLINPEQPDAVSEAIMQLLEHPEQARQFGQNGRDHVLYEFTDTVRATRFTQALGIMKEEQPMVSIIIPAYQSANTITCTLNSIQSQTYKNIEVIVVNDGSTDRLKNIIDGRPEKIIYVEQKNSGAPVARNSGVAQSHGDFILFCDADIVLQPHAVNTMVTALQTHSASSFAYSAFYHGWKKFTLHEYSLSALRNMNYIHTTSLIRRVDVIPFDPSLKKFQDWDLWLTMAEQGKTGIWIPETLFRLQPRDSAIGISSWLPKFMYRLPGIGQGQGSETIKRYRQAESIVRKKHNI